MRYSFAIKKRSTSGDDYWLKVWRPDTDHQGYQQPKIVMAEEPWQAAQILIDTHDLEEGQRFMVIEEPHGRCMREYEASYPRQPLKPKRVRS